MRKEEEEEEGKEEGNCILQLPPSPAVGEEEDKKGNCGLQLPACLAHGGPGDNNTRPAPLEEKGDEEEEEEEEGKRVAYNSQHALCVPTPETTTPSTPCAPPLPGTGSPSQGHRSAPVPQHSTAGHLHRCSLFVPQQGTPQNRGFAPLP